MPRKIDTAYIEYLPDFSAFERTADRELGAIFRDVERVAGQSTTRMETDFAKLEDDIKENFNDAVFAANLDLNRLSAAAATSAAEVARDFEKSGEVAEASFSEFRRSAEVDLARLDAAATASAAATSKKFSMAGLAGSAALFGIGTAAVAGLGALATMGLSSAANLEQVQISFNALLGSAEEGTRVFKQLQQFAAVTPFEFPEVAAAAKRFLAFAGTVGMGKEQLQGFLTTVGDLASVTGAGAEGMNRIVLALGQIASKGKTSLEELMQIGEAVPGFSPIAAIADALGTTTADAMAKISAGTVDAKTGIDALLVGMQKFPGAAGAMEKQSQTLLGVFSTFKDTVGQALADSFAPAIPAIKETLTQITPILGDALRQVAPALGGVITGLLSAIGPLVQALTPILTPLLDALGPALAQLGPPLVPLGKALGEVAVALAPILPLLASFLVAVLELATPLIELLVPVLQLLTPVLQFAADAVGEFAKWLGTIDWGHVGHEIGDAFATAWHATLDFFVGIGRWFKRLPDQVGAFIKSIPDRVVQAFSDMATLVLHLIGMWIGGVLFVFTQLPGQIIQAIAVLGPQLAGFLGNLWDSILTNAHNRWNEMIDFIASIPDRVLNGLRILLTVVPDLLHQAWQNGVDTVQHAIESIIGFVTGLPKRLTGFAADVGGGIVDFIKRALNSAISKVNEGIAAVDSVLPGDLPRIPLLAKGGVAFGPSVIGEAGAEAAIPLTDPSALRMLRDALGTGGPTIQPGGIVVNVSINGTVTPEQAKKIGQNVGVGIQQALSQNDIATAVRRA